MKVEYKPIERNALCKVTKAGTITEIMKSENGFNNEAHIKKLNRDSYVVLSTGEIKEIEHNETRADDKQSLRKTFARIRNLINANISENPQNALWITLTYAENMTDTERLYTDFDKFNKRFQYWLKKVNLPKAEYISVIEPQSRGAWHIHMFYIFPFRAPFISNENLRKLWGHGFVRVNRCNDNIDNIGAYLTAYLGNIPVEEFNENCVTGHNMEIIECPVESVDEMGNSTTTLKRFVKGGRLKLYPAGMNLYRHSKNIKEPEIKYEYVSDKEKRVNQYGTLTYSSSLSFSSVGSDGLSFENTLTYEYYNRSRSESQ